MYQCSYLRSSRSQMFFSDNVASLKACSFITKRLQHRCFLKNFAKSLRAPFMQNSSANKTLKRSKIDRRREVAKKISTKQKSFALKKLFCILEVTQRSAGLSFNLDLFLCQVFLYLILRKYHQMENTIFLL